MVPPLVYSLFITYYPLHLWVYFMGLFYVKYNFIFDFEIYYYQFYENIIFIFDFKIYYYQFYENIIFIFDFEIYYYQFYENIILKYIIINFMKILF